MEEAKDTVMVVVEPGGSSTGQEQPAPRPNIGDVLLLSRLVVGLLFFGGEELLLRLRSVQQRIESRGELAAGEVIPNEETTAEALGYLAVGILIRGGKRLARAVNRGIHLSMDVAGWTVGSFSRLTDNRLARPLRQPIERGIRGLMGQGEAAIHDGRREVYASRELADETLDEVIEELIQALAENPELTSAIERVLVGQGAGLTGTAMGSARQLGTSADDLTEGVVWRLLGRKPRRELPPSPLAGKPRTMYERRNSAQGAQDDES
jgi:hypothetical protein